MNNGRVLVQATVTAVVSSRPVYPCCRQCYNKLHQDFHTNSWLCQACQIDHQTENISWRYCLNITIADSDAACNVAVFGKTLEPFFGVTANKFNSIITSLETEDDSVETLHRSLEETFVGNTFLFGFKSHASIARLKKKSTSSPITLAQILHGGKVPKNRIANQERNNLVAVLMISPYLSPLPTVASNTCKWKLYLKHTGFTSPNSRQDNQEESVTSQISFKSSLPEGSCTSSCDTFYSSKYSLLGQSSLGFSYEESLSKLYNTVSITGVEKSDVLNGNSVLNTTQSEECVSSPLHTHCFVVSQEGKSHNAFHTNGNPSSFLKITKTSPCSNVLSGNLSNVSKSLLMDLRNDELTLENRVNNNSQTHVTVDSTQNKIAITNIGKQKFTATTVYMKKEIPLKHGIQNDDRQQKVVNYAQDEMLPVTSLSQEEKEILRRNEMSFDTSVNDSSILMAIIPSQPEDEMSDKLIQRTCCISPNFPVTDTPIHKDLLTIDNKFTYDCSKISDVFEQLFDVFDDVSGLEHQSSQSKSISEFKECIPIDIPESENYDFINFSSEVLDNVFKDEMEDQQENVKLSQNSQSLKDARLSQNSQSLKDARLSQNSQSLKYARLSQNSQSLKDARLSQNSQSLKDARQSQNSQSLQDARLSQNSQSLKDARHCAAGQDRVVQCLLEKFTQSVVEDLPESEDLDEFLKKASEFGETSERELSLHTEIPCQFSSNNYHKELMVSRSNENNNGHFPTNSEVPACSSSVSRSVCKTPGTETYDKSLNGDLTKNKLAKKTSQNVINQSTDHRTNRRHRAKQTDSISADCTESSQRYAVQIRFDDNLDHPSNGTAISNNDFNMVSDKSHFQHLLQPKELMKILPQNTVLNNTLPAKFSDGTEKLSEAGQLCNSLKHNSCIDSDSQGLVSQIQINTRKQILKYLKADCEKQRVEVMKELKCYSSEKLSTCGVKKFRKRKVVSSGTSDHLLQASTYYTDSTYKTDDVCTPMSCVKKLRKKKKQNSPSPLVDRVDFQIAKQSASKIKSKHVDMESCSSCDSLGKKENFIKTKRNIHQQLNLDTNLLSTVDNTSSSVCNNLSYVGQGIGDLVPRLKGSDNQGIGDLVPRQKGCDNQGIGDLVPRQKGCDNQGIGDLVPRQKGCDNQSIGDLLPRQKGCDNQGIGDLVPRQKGCDNQGIGDLVPRQKCSDILVNPQNDAVLEQDCSMVQHQYKTLENRVDSQSNKIISKNCSIKKNSFVVVKPNHESEPLFSDQSNNMMSKNCGIKNNSCIIIKPNHESEPLFSDCDESLLQLCGQNGSVRVEASTLEKSVPSHSDCSDYFDVVQSKSRCFTSCNGSADLFDVHDSQESISAKLITKYTPPKNARNSTLQKSASSYIPLKSSFNLTPVKSSVNLTPTKSSIKLTPTINSIKLTPMIHSMKLTPVQSSFKLIPQKSISKLTPMKSWRKCLGDSSQDISCPPDQNTNTCLLTSNHSAHRCNIDASKCLPHEHINSDEGMDVSIVGESQEIVGNSSEIMKTLPTSTSKHVKFSKRLSHVSSVKLMDIRMMLTSSPIYNVPNSSLKSCLKKSETTPPADSEALFSQDLFSPSPIFNTEISGKVCKSVSGKNGNCRRQPLARLTCELNGSNGNNEFRTKRDSNCISPPVFGMEDWSAEHHRSGSPLLFSESTYVSVISGEKLSSPKSVCDNERSSLLFSPELFSP